MKKVTDNHRFYVVIPKHPTKEFQMPCGMAAAQAAHAVSKLRLAHVKNHKNGLAEMEKPITTIVLQVRDQKEATHIRNLAELKKIPFEIFCDTNDAIYGNGKLIETATAFGPITKEEAALVLDYQPLWDCDDSKCRV